MSPEELLGRLTPVPVPAVDSDGYAIAELAGCHLKPLDVEDVLAVAEYQKIHGERKGYQMIFVRAVGTLDASGNFVRTLSDEHAPRIASCTDGPTERAVGMIRRISGKFDTEEKKTFLTNGQNGHSSSASRANSERPPENS